MVNITRVQQKTVKVVKGFDVFPVLYKGHAPLAPGICKLYPPPPEIQAPKELLNRVPIKVVKPIACEVRNWLKHLERAWQVLSVLFGPHDIAHKNRT